MDLDGHCLQMLEDPDPEWQETLQCGVLAAGGGGAVVMLWPKNQSAPRRFVSSLLTKGQHALPGLLVQFMFAYIENTFFSTEWWESLAPGERQQLAMLARTPNPHYTPFAYSGAHFVPWEIITAEIEDAC